MERDINYLSTSKILLLINEILKQNSEVIDELKQVLGELKKKNIAHSRKRGLDKVLFIEDVAEALGVTMNTIYRYISKGHLASIKIGNRHLFYEEDIQSLLDRYYNGKRLKK